jgi:hypothetical protein
MDHVALRQIQRALRAGKSLSDEQVAKLAQLRRAENVGKQHVAVAKFALREGEELWDFVDAIWMAVQTNRVILADGSLDAWLVGIYDEHVIVQDGNTGRLFKASFTRNEKGEFSFGEPVEVRQTFVEVTAAGADDGEGAEKAVSRRAAADVEYLEISKRRRDSSKFGFLPPTLRGRR